MTRWFSTSQDGRLLGPSPAPKYPPKLVNIIGGWTIVVEEYQTAWPADPGKVLVFVRDVRRDQAAAAHLRAVSRNHKYARVTPTPRGYAE